MQIISGTLKGLILETSSKQRSDKNLRPTTNYSKQVLFNLLNNNKDVQLEIEGKTILDGFAGTGSVGVEFFSRGAAHVTFVDSNLDNIKKLKENTAKLGVSASVISAFLPDMGKIKAKFDIVFLDPPYEDGKGRVAQTIKNLLENHLNPEGGIIILEGSTQKKDLEDFKKHLIKKQIEANLFYEKESGSRTCFFFFKPILKTPDEVISESKENV